MGCCASDMLALLGPQVQIQASRTRSRTKFRGDFASSAVGGIGMAPRAYWSPAALEVREAQDALLCLEAAHSSSFNACLDAQYGEGRHDCLPQIQVGVCARARPRRSAAAWRRGLAFGRAWQANTRVRMRARSLGGPAGECNDGRGAARGSHVPRSPWVRCVQDAPAPGWTVARRVRSRGRSDASRGVRLFKAEVQYTIGPAGGAAHPAGPEPEVLLVYALSAPAHMLEEALAARRGPRGAKGFFFKKKTDTPSITGMHGSDGAKPSWSQAARELYREIAEDLLTHTCNAVFEEGPSTAADRGAPAIKASLQRAKSIILTGHGAGALVAYEATLSLLRLYPEALKAKLKCITFGMPVMGWDGREQRDCLLRLIAPTLHSIPMLRRDLPCPHFLHILRQEDLVPATALCSRKLRSSVAAALSVAADRRNALGQHWSALSPYSKALCDELVKLDRRQSVLDAADPGGAEAARDGADGPVASSSSHHASVSPTTNYDSDDSDAGYAGSSHAAPEEMGEADAAEGDAADTASQSWRWPKWKKNKLIGVNGDKVDWDVVCKAVRQDIAHVPVPEWWALGKFWFFCDSHPFDAPASPLSSPNHRSDHKRRQSHKAMATSANGKETNNWSASTRRDGTVVRVRRWVVQFPYLVHLTPQGKRELFEPFPDSVALLRDMLASGVDQLQHVDKPHLGFARTPHVLSKDERARAVGEARRCQWPVQHHLGQYINALHSWVGSSEWQISRRRELSSSILQPASKGGSKAIVGAAATGAAASSTSQPGLALSNGGRDGSREERLASIAESPSPPARETRQTLDASEVPACQAKADFAYCSCVSDGVKTLLQLSVRGRNLHFVEAIDLVLLAWPADQSEEANGSAGSASLSALHAYSSENARSAHRAEANGNEQASVDSSMHIAMRLLPEACGPSGLVATCEAPYGWLGAAVHARLLGSCICEEHVPCDISGLTSFRALHGLAATLENTAVCDVLHRALLLQELVSSSTPALYAGKHGRTDTHADAHVAPSARVEALEDGQGATCRRQGRAHGTKEGGPVQVGDVTALPLGLPLLLLHTCSGAQLLQDLIAELMNLEHKTRSQWSDFMRTISLGGLDPHPPSPYEAAGTHVNGSRHPQAIAEHSPAGVGHGRDGEDTPGDKGRTLERGASMQWCGWEGMAERLHHIDALLNRPLSLSMDRSPRFKQMMGLTLAMTAGATIMAGSCLLAPYAAASVMPTVAAYVTPAHAVTGMFATSMVGTHMQARCTIDGSYREKLSHLALALRIDMRNIRPVSPPASPPLPPFTRLFPARSFVQLPHGR